MNLDLVKQSARNIIEIVERYDEALDRRKNSSAQRDIKNLDIELKNLKEKFSEMIRDIKIGLKNA